LTKKRSELQDAGPPLEKGGGPFVLRKNRQAAKRESQRPPSSFRLGKEKGEKDAGRFVSGPFAKRKKKTVSTS